MLHNALTFNEQNTKARWNIFEPNVFKRQPAHPADSIRNNSNSLNEYTLRKIKPCTSPKGFSQTYFIWAIFRIVFPDNDTLCHLIQF